MTKEKVTRGLFKLHHSTLKGLEAVPASPKITIGINIVRIPESRVKMDVKTMENIYFSYCLIYLTLK